MNRFRQCGQSMTEYLVVLGVTGAALVATTSDVNRLYSNVRDGYENQSREMNKVQVYNNPKVQFNENESEPEGEGDGEKPPTYDEELPDADSQLPSIELVYDQYNKPIGRMKGDTLIDENGDFLAFCQRTPAGDCVFVDADGNILYPGATSQRRWVDENGNELPMMAMTLGGNVVGFAYLYKGKYYSSADRKLLDPQPTGLSAKPMRTTSDILDGKVQVTGYELNGRLYSIKQTLEGKPTFDQTQDPQKEELVNVVFNVAPTSNWDGYKPCLVMPAGWNTIYATGDLLSGAWESKFNDPSQRLSLGPIKGAGGFVDASASDCGGLSTATYDPVTSKWMLSK